jgi:glycosidase
MRHFLKGLLVLAVVVCNGANVTAAQPAQTAATTDWFKSAVIYAIFPRSFADSNGDGIGDLQGIIAKLDYIQGLGANTIWLMPPFVTPSYHGYNVADYYHIDPSLGTDADLVALINAVHNRHMRFILDYVADHTADTHPFFKDAYGNPQSQYSDFYMWLNPQHTDYQHFAIDLTMPRLNFDTPAVNAYMLKVAQFYLDMGVDGFRCDVAGLVPHSFWQSLRKIINASYPGRILLGEFWTDRAQIPDYLDSGEFDAAFDFPVYMDLVGLHETDGIGVLNGQNPVSLVTDRLKAAHSGYLVRFLGNHDTNRLISIVQDSQLRARAAAVWLTTLPGPIQIYQGDELGVTGSKSDQPTAGDLPVRLPFPWNTAKIIGNYQTTWTPSIVNTQTISVEAEKNDVLSLDYLYRTVLAMRQTDPVFSSDNTEWITTNPNIYQMRRTAATGQQIMVLINFSNDIQEFPIPSSDPLITANPIIDTGVYQITTGTMRLNPGGYAIFETVKP